MSRVDVRCYSGYRADQRPVRFLLGGRTFQIVDVEELRTADGDIYILKHDEASDNWDLSGYRRHSEQTGRESS